jgi:hypothetical protein
VVSRSTVESVSSVSDPRVQVADHARPLAAWGAHDDEGVLYRGEILSITFGLRAERPEKVASDSSFTYSVWRPDQECVAEGSAIDATDFGAECGCRTVEKIQRFAILPRGRW